MWQFAFQNLLTRPIRTILGLVGLSIPILGVVGLFSLSSGLRQLVGNTLSQVEGVMILRENTPSPVFSDLPVSYKAEIAEVSGVRVVVPEVWGLAPPIENQGILARTIRDAASGFRRGPASLFESPLIQGQPVGPHARLRSAVYPNNMIAAEDGGGRFLDERDVNRNRIVISTKIAKQYPVVDPETGESRPRRVGDRLLIQKTEFEIIGLYETNSLILDQTIIMDLPVAQTLLGINEDQVSCFYIEMSDPGRAEEVAAAVEERLDQTVSEGQPRVDANTMAEFMANFDDIMGQLNVFLALVVSLALLVGVVGIVNTMLMSTTERFVEFGVLRTNGWSKRHVLSLVTAESAMLGLLGGIVGCLLAVLLVLMVNPFIEGGLQLDVSPALLALGLSLAVIMGVVGGLYPAWKASNLVPMEAIRLGSH